MMKRLTFVLCSILFLSSSYILLPLSSYASVTFPVNSKESPHFWLDLNFYVGDDANTRTELYYSVPLPELAFNNSTDSSLASFTIDITIMDKNGATAFHETRRKGARASSEADKSDASKGVVDQINVLLSPGGYDIKCELRDDSSDKQSLIEGAFQVPQFGTDLTICEPQLAGVISSDTSNSIFVKANRAIFPNPSRKYKYQDSILYLYLEVFNLKYDTEQEQQEFEISYVISDIFGDSLIVIPPQQLQKPGTSAIKMQALDIRGLEKGKHILTTRVYDPISDQTDVKQKMFEVHGEPLDPNSLPLTKDDIKNYRDQIKYIATSDELKTYDSITAKEKGAFIVNFWRSKDEDKTTPENEFMLDYFSRIRYTEKQFRGKDGGMNSDMGRIFIVYGQPDDVERNQMQFETKSYEIWQYYTAGGKHEFVFVDRNNIGIYSLVHSTVLEEIKNPDWRQSEL
jgi:GWxTD domain-containing protein